MTDQTSEIQDKQYMEFPYHYIPYIDQNGYPSITRLLPWGYEYLAMVGYLKGKILGSNPEKLLDVGCGDGRLIYEIKGDIHQCYGIDLSKVAINYAKAFNFEENCNFDVKRVQDLTEQFDVVTCIEVLEHIPDHEIESFLTGLWNCVKCGGTLVITVPSAVIPLSTKHYRHYTEESLLSSLKIAKIPLDLTTCEYIINHRMNQRVNKYISIKIIREFSCFRGRLWEWYLKRVVSSNPSSGRHIVLTVKKTIRRRRDASI